MQPPGKNRPLSASEFSLARWMLENGKPEAGEFLDQLASATVTSWRCPCGCGSINFHVEGGPATPTERIHILGDYFCGPEDAPSGIFIFAKAGILSGIEIYGLASDPLTELPHEESLRDFVSRPDPPAPTK